MKKIILVGIAMFAVMAASAQNKYFTKNGKIFFSASSPAEKIEATNEKAFSIFNDSAGSLEFAVLMKAFISDKALMQEHFNENYVESDKYPKATYKGKITNLEDVDFTKDGKYALKVEGEMSLHGVTQPVNTKAEATVTNGVILAKAEFYLVVKDFNIEIPRLVVNNISDKILVNLKFRYQPTSIKP